MADLIRLSSLRATGVHGVLEEEKRRAQPFEVNIEIEVDLTVAGRTDRLDATINYGLVAAAAAGVIVGPSVELLETLAQRIADEVFEIGGPRAEAVTVEVIKLRPPVPEDLAASSVVITRTRPA